MLDRTHTPEKRSSLLQDATSAAFQKAVVGRGKAIEALQKKVTFTDDELSKAAGAAGSDTTVSGTARYASQAGCEDRADQNPNGN